MFKYLEVGAWTVAGLLSLALYNNLTSTQERLKQSADARLDATETFNREAVERVLEIDPTPKKTAADPVPVKELRDDDIMLDARKCFKKRECAKLAEAVYFEDRGGNIEGMKAVANVVMNRVNSGKFPDSVAGVVNQKKWTKRGWVCQFSYMCQLKDRTMTDEDSRYKAGYVAWKATNGVLRDRTNGADHYLNKSKVKTMPNWVYAFNKTVKIGDHTFYASKEI